MFHLVCLAATVKFPYIYTNGPFVTGVTSVLAALHSINRIISYYITPVDEKNYY
jgi:hypothetical protein